MSSMFSSRVAQALDLDEPDDDEVREALHELNLDMDKYLASEHGEQELLEALCWIKKDGSDDHGRGEKNPRKVIDKLITEARKAPNSKVRIKVLKKIEWLRRKHNLL